MFDDVATYSSDAILRACRATIADREQIKRSCASLDRSREILKATGYASGLRVPEGDDGKGSNLPEPNSLQSELLRLREQQADMAAELQHRTRNLIAVVQSLANRTMRRTGPTEAFQRQFAGQLTALSRVQGQLSRSDQEPITMRGLIEMELGALEPDLQNRIVLKGPKVSIRKAVVQSFALVLHELITTARHYGALAGEQGRLTVMWRGETRDEGRWLVLDWIEEGFGLTHEEASIRHGCDRELIERALPYELGGKGRYHIGTAELRCSIDFPLPTRSKSER